MTATVPRGPSHMTSQACRPIYDKITNISSF